FVYMGTVYPMAAIPCITLAPVAPWSWYVYIEIDSTTVYQHNLYVDDVIVTVDEP
ncbi:unnamed protein product, partial [marine sediment metagenome]